MGLFLTHGFPEPSSTAGLLDVLARNGADFIELGMPFSDPLAEGIPIQRSSERALRQGVTLEGVLESAAAFRAGHETPLLLMGYINPLFHYGVERFFSDARSAGVDGIILPDVPLEEVALVEAEARRAGVDLVLLVAPNTSDDRMAAIDEKASGFVYAVSVTGLTGAALAQMTLIEAYLDRARLHVRRNPLMVGFGIRSAQDAARLSRHTDGFIVGSALIEEIERLWADPTLNASQRLDAVGAFVRDLKSATLIAYPDE